MCEDGADDASGKRGLLELHAVQTPQHEVLHLAQPEAEEKAKPIKNHRSTPVSHVHLKCNRTQELTSKWGKSTQGAIALEASAHQEVRLKEQPQARICPCGV